MQPTDPKVRGSVFHTLYLVFGGLTKPPVYSITYTYLSESGLIAAILTSAASHSAKGATITVVLYILYDDSRKYSR